MIRFQSYRYNSLLFLSLFSIFYYKKRSFFVPLVFILFSIFYFLFSYSVHAASFTLSFEGPAQVAVDKEFAVTALLNTDQPMNAYVMNFSYDTDRAELIGFDTSRSFIDVWANQPTVREPGIKGGSTAPFSGSRGEILTMRFRALREGVFSVRFQAPALYLANGKGTKVIPNIKEYGISILPFGAQIEDSVTVKNNMPPEIKYLAFIDDPFNKDHRLLSFSIHDGGAGIVSASYRFRKWMFWSEARPAINPMALQANTWAAELVIVDGEGNLVNKIIYDWRIFAKGPMALLILVGIASVFIINKTRKNRGVIMK